MTVIILNKGSNRTRGTLSHFMYEIHKNIFVGNISTRVRDRIENDIIRKNNEIACVIYDSSCESGFKVDSIGEPSVLFDTLGSFLVRHK